jgi:hypothetical protein
MKTQSEIFLEQYAEQANLRDAAVRATASLIANYDAGEITRADIFDRETFTVERFMIAGGGPTAYAVFLLDEDSTVESGYIEYTEHKTAIVPIPDWIAPELHDALRNAR